MILETDNLPAESGRGAWSLQAVLALLGVVLFFRFFGNGASDDPSLFSWIQGNLTVDSWCVLAPLAGVTALLLFSKKFRHRALSGPISATGALWLQGCGTALAAAAFIAGRPELSYVGFWALLLWVPIAFHGRGVRAYLLLLLLALFSLPSSPLAIFTPMLQAGTTSAVKLGLTGLGIEFESDGTLIAVHGFSSRIAEECSGLRSIHLATALSLLVAALFPMRWLGAVVLTAAAVGLAAVGNLIRVFLVIGFGVWRGSEFAMSVGHELVGPAFAIILLLAFFYFFPGMLVRRFPRKAGTCRENRTPASVSKQLTAALLFLAAGALICSLIGGAARAAETASSPPGVQDATASENPR